MAITPEYKAYLKYDPKWKAKRLKVLRRAKYKCEQCKRRQATQVHHLTYKNLRDKNGVMGNEPLSDLLAVCVPCHEKIHGIKDKHKKKSIFRYLGQVYQKVIG